MKNIGYVLFAAALGLLSGCSDDTIEQKEPVIPAQTGDEISFGSSLGDAQTRTVYDDQITTEGERSYYKVFWEDGENGSEKDQIAIYCPEASNRQLVNYVITPDPADKTKSSLVTKVNTDEAGLQWGESPTHHFYGFYPASAVTGTEDGRIKGHVPTTQNVVRWEPKPEGTGTTYYGVANTDYAYMWAYGEYQKETMGGQHVPLLFHSWMTVIDIEIPGPATDAEGAIAVSNINIEATAGTQTVLAGDFICDMSKVEAGEGAPDYEYAGAGGEVNNRISISCYDEDTESFVSLRHGDKLIVRAFLLPIDDKNATNARNIKIRVSFTNGSAALERTLGYSGEEHGPNSIIPHRVNKVVLPNLTRYGTNYWMSSLDKNIYLTELSIPGSKFSYSWDTTPQYQGHDIQTQFKDGVRAFHVQTIANATYNRHLSWNGWVADGFESGTLEIENGPAGSTLENTLDEIIAAFQTADTELNQRGITNQECAIVMITYETASANTMPDGGAHQVWMETVEYVLDQLANSSTYGQWIYQDEINANTTLDMAKRKIIFKVNYNKDDNSDMADYATANGRLPALFSYWNGLKNTQKLQWGTASPTYNGPEMEWMYQEATHVGSAGEAGFANTAEIKLANITDVFEESVDEYIASVQHNKWFMNDCGGVFSGTVTGTNGYDGNYNASNANSTTQLAKWLNREVTNLLQVRTQNASTGLVFFNFADRQADSGGTYGTNNLIQTIIDNNFKFNLRKAGSSTSQNAPADASFSNGGNVW